MLEGASVVGMFVGHAIAAGLDRCRPMGRGAVRRWCAGIRSSRRHRNAGQHDHPRYKFSRAVSRVPYRLLPAMRWSRVMGASVNAVRASGDQVTRSPPNSQYTSITRRFVACGEIPAQAAQNATHPLSL